MILELARGVFDGADSRECGGAFAAAVVDGFGI